MRKLTLVFIFFVVGVAFFFSFYLKPRLDSFSRQLLPLLKEKLSEELGENVTIQGARLGLLDHLTLYNLSGSLPTKFGERPFVEIEEVILNYKLPDIVFGRFQEPSLILIRDGSLKWKTEHFLIERDRINGVVELIGPTETKVRFSSDIEKGGSISCRGKIHSGNKGYNLALELSHIDFEWGNNPLFPVSNISGTILLNEEEVSSQLLSASIGKVLVELSGNVSRDPTSPQLDCLIGSLNLPDQFAAPFRADLDLGARILTVGVGPKEELKLFARLGEGFEAALKVNHLKLNNLDLVTELNLESEVLKGEDERAVTVGRISSKNSILDYEPFMELEGTYRIEGSILKVPGLSLGEVYKVDGTVGLVEPFPLDLTFEMHGSDMAQLFAFARGMEEGALRGKVEGKISIKGPASSPKINGRCVVSDGSFGEVEYRSMVLNLDGVGRLIQIKDSRIYQEEGVLILEGEIDLAKANPYEDVVIRSGEERIVWKGWDVTRPEDSEELTMKKTVGENFQVNFKTYLDDELSTGDIQDDEVTVEYGVNGIQRIKVKLKGEEEFLGVEHKLEF